MSSFTLQHRFSHHTFLMKALTVLWIALTLFGEVWVFVWSLFECKWPLASNKSTRVLLIADTQIQHHALLPKDSWWFHPFRRILFELNLRKSWHITSYLRPNAVVFLGDMLSNGKAAKDPQQYGAAAHKFKSVFHTDPQAEVFYIPGNNDVGLGLDRFTSHRLRSFYQDFFGPPNRQFVLQNHTFIAIDSAGLVEEDYLRNGERVSFQNWIPLPNGTVSFVEQVAQEKPADPVILLSHIPLARADSAKCGPLRERGTIRRGAGPGWQSTLSKQSTNFLLNTLRPSIIFSADNRDYCDYTHTIPQPDSRRDESMKGYPVREITLKSFSMSLHIRRPGFQLLTLVDPASVSPTHSEQTSHTPPSLTERACFLPDQFRIYNYLYAPLFVVSLVILARFHFLKLKKGQLKTKPPFLVLKTGLPRRISEDDGVCESPNSLILPSAPSTEPIWSPFAPFTPVTPLIPTTTNMRQPSITSLTSIQSGLSSRSSTTTLLGGGEGEGCHPNNELDEQELMYDAAPLDYANAMGGRTDRLSFSLTWESAAREQRHCGFGSRYPYVRESTVDLESFQDEEVVGDEEAAPATPSMACVKPESVKANGNLILDGKPKRKRSFGWFTTSYSFVFRGRRRRIRLGLPSRSALWNLMEFVGVADGSRLRTGKTRRTSGLGGYLDDVFDVFWPAAVLWLVVNGVTMLL